MTCSPLQVKKGTGKITIKCLVPCTLVNRKWRPVKSRPSQIREMMSSTMLISASRRRRGTKEAAGATFPFHTEAAVDVCLVGADGPFFSDCERALTCKVHITLALTDRSESCSTTQESLRALVTRASSALTSCQPSKGCLKWTL